MKSKPRKPVEKATAVLNEKKIVPEKPPVETGPAKIGIMKGDFVVRRTYWVNFKDLNDLKKYFRSSAVPSIELAYQTFFDDDVRISKANVPIAEITADDYNWLAEKYEFGVRFIRL